MTNQSLTTRSLFDHFLFLLCLIFFFNLFWLPSVLAATNCNIRVTTIQNECNALIKLYNNTNGPNWFDRSSNNWNVTNTPCTWAGIKCIDGRVTEIDRKDKNLRGSIPDLSALTNLQRLDLSINQLRGLIPNLSGLKYLEYLQLDHNQLTGAIPDLSGLEFLATLQLDHNQLTGAIPDLSGLESLATLQLDHNQLTGTIPNLNRLPNLQILSLGDNPLESGPILGWIKGLTQLTKLGLSNSGRTGIIPDLSTLIKLQYLDLSKNHLSGTIEILSLLKILKNLQLDHNQFTGPIPNLSHLKESLEVLYLGDNPLESGPIPEWIKGLTRLETLGLSNSGRTGNIEWINDLTKLEYLQLDHNQLKGSIPDLSKLTQLKWLFLNNNRLEGYIPDLSKSTALEILYLQSNQLTSSIPTSLSNLTKLKHLNLEYNRLIAQDRTLLTFLNEKNPAWEWTQTVPPTDIKTKTLSRNSIQISWTPISYTGDGGYYQVKYATTPDGSYISTISTTANKTAIDYIVNDLLPDTTYYFVVETYTPPHALNPDNKLTSELSPPVIANTIIPSLAPLPPTMNLTVAIGGDGHGQVTTNPSGLDCNSREQKCSYSYDTASWVNLTATPAADSEFTGWGGYQSDCDNGELFMSGYRYCMAYFERLRFPLIVTVVGQGKVNSMPVGIDCGTRCRYRFEISTQVTLTTIPDTNWQFEKWQGDCNANGLVIMDKEKQCEAVFVTVSPDISGVPLTSPSNTNSNLTVSNNQPALTDQCSNSSHNPDNNCSATVISQQNLAKSETIVPTLPPAISSNNILESATETVNLTDSYETTVPQLVVNPGSHHFDNIPVGNFSPAQVITVTNAGYADLQLGQLTVSSNEFILAETCSNQILSAGNHCAATVNFQPQLVGIKTAYLAIPIDNPNQTTVTVVTLTGKGNIITDPTRLTGNTDYLIRDDTIDLPLLVTFSSPLTAVITPTGVELNWEIAETNRNQIAEIHLWKAEVVKNHCPEDIHQYDPKTSVELANKPHLDYQGTDTTCYGLQVIEYNGDVTWYITQAK